MYTVKLESNRLRPRLILDTLPTIVEITFLPPIPLFEIVLDTEGWLFLNSSIHPLGLLPRFVEVQPSSPVAPDAAVVAHVEADLGAQGLVYDKAAAFDAPLAAVEKCEGPAQF